MVSENHQNGCVSFCAVLAVTQLFAKALPQPAMMQGQATIDRKDPSVRRVASTTKRKSIVHRVILHTYFLAVICYFAWWANTESDEFQQPLIFCAVSQLPDRWLLFSINLHLRANSR